MNQSHININQNYSQFEDDDEEEGILSKTASFISSVFYKVANSINPFKAKKNVQNPYDLNNSNDPSNYLNNLENMNNNIYTSSAFTNYNNNQNFHEQNFNKNSKNYLTSNNFEKLPNNQAEDDLYVNVDYITVDDFCNISPHLKEEIYKDIKRPNYIPNEEIFQKAKKYVYDNLVPKYKLMKPKISDKIFGESVLLLAIQLTNKYNIEKHYDYLVNNRRNTEYKFEINVPEIIKDYYTNKAKTLFHEDLTENSEKISNDINKELLNKFSNGLFNNKKDNDDNNLNNSSENRLVCRTPKTKRNYITCLFENKYNYDYLCPNDKVQIQIYKECLLHKENELRNYARVIEVTNNMFKLTCNENQKLRDVIKQKEEKIEDFAQQIVLYKIKDNEKQRKIDDYENEIKNLKNISQNNIQNSQNINDNNNVINNNLNIPSQNSSLNNNIAIDNLNSKSSIFTLKKPYEPQHEFSFCSNSNNNIFSSQKTATFNNKNSNNTLNFSKSNKNNSDSNSVLVLNNQSLNKNDNKESEQKKPQIFFSFTQTEEKKEENKINSDSNTSDKKEEINNFNLFNSVANESKKNINFGFIEDKKEEKNNNNPFGDNNPINDNNNSNKNNNINFGFISEEKNENEEEKKEEEIKKEINNEIKEDKKEEIKEKNNLDDSNKEKEKNIQEEKKEESGEKMNISLPETKEEPKKEEKNEQIVLKKESLNNPNNPFLSAVNIKTNEEFSVNFLKGEKDNNKNDISDRSSTRNTMDNTNTLIKIGDYSNLDNSNSNSFTFNNNSNNFIEAKNFSQGNPFLIGQNNDKKEFKNPFMIQTATQEDTSMNIDNNNKNINSNNIFLNNNSNTNFNTSNNNNSQQNNPFLMTSRSNSQNNNSSNNNNPFLSFNTNNNGNQSLARSQNPFMSQTNEGTTSIFQFNNNDTKRNDNPFISSLSNAIVNATNNNSNNNVSNSNNQNNNPFISFGNNNNNGSSISNNLNSNNPFLKNDNLPSSNSQAFGITNHNDNNSSSNNSNSLFSFKINTQEGTNRVNPFLSNKNGFDFGSSNKSNNAFAMGVNMKKPGGNNYISIFEDNKPRKIGGFFN